MVKNSFFIIFILISIHLNAADLHTIIYPYFSLSHTNDFNPLLRQLSNDTGYTLGADFHYRNFLTNKNGYFDIRLTSDLYTQYMNSNTFFYEEYRLIRTQLFTEVSTLSFNYVFMPTTKNYVLDLGGGFGIQNKKKPIPGLTLWTQGGRTGRDGYHGWIENLPWKSNPGQQNISTGDVKRFVFIHPAISKYFIFENQHSSFDPAYIKIKADINASTLLAYNYTQFQCQFEIPVFQTQQLLKQALKFALIGTESVNYFLKDGMQILPQLGLLLRFWKIETSYSTQWLLGKQPQHLVTYSDNETIMTLKFTYRWE